MSSVQTPMSVRESFERQKRVADLLKIEVDLLLAQRSSAWHVTSRVKSLDSFIEKLQTGRVYDQDKMEDLFAATLVVPNRGELAVAEAFVKGFMEVTERRPPAGPTKLPASDFRFDDIRLYGHLLADDSLPGGPIYEMVFEVQVKTFLQHAWAVATHDTVYKTDRTSWARNRMAYQIRALLEHAESVVDAIDVYDASATNAAVGTRESRLQEVIDFIQANWHPDFLPTSLIRASENIMKLCADLKVDAAEFLEKLKDAIPGDGLPFGQSPYDFAVAMVCNQYPREFTKLLTRRDNKASVYYVTDEALTLLGLSTVDAPCART